MSVLAQLSEFAASIDSSAAPVAVTSKAKACLLYGLAVGIGGVASPHPPKALAAFPSPAARPQDAGATTLLDGRCREPGAAAFCNAVLLHARIQEDAHAAGHMGVVVIPAALAVCEFAGADGPRLLSSIIAGYEVALRIGRAHSADLSQRGFRTTSVYGAIGAAAAVARARGCDATVTANAMGLAANFSGGLREFAGAGSDEYAFQAGHAAQGGMLAASLAAAGVRAAASTFEGPAGFFRAFGRADRSYDAAVSADSAASFVFLETTFKPYPVCQFHRGIVRGCIELRGEAAGRELASLAIRMHPFEADFIGVRYPGPYASFPQTFMSAPFCAALAFARGAVTYAGLHDFAAADVCAIVPRIRVVADESRLRYGPRLEAALNDGCTLQWEETLGEDAYRLDWENAVSMARALADEAAVPRPLIERLIDTVTRLDGDTGTREVIAAALAACRAASKT